jgi:hypothetical protein
MQFQYLTNARTRRMNKYQYLILFKLTFIFAVLCNILGCKKLTEVSPPTTSVTEANVFNSDATATAVLTGLYTQISQTGYVGGTCSMPTLSLWAGLSADELALWNGVTDPKLIAYYTNSLSGNTAGFEFWGNAYTYIYTCNSAIEGITNSTGLSNAVRQQLLGEAKFMRGFFYFYLVNLYGDVPLALTSDYKSISVLKRDATLQVYQQIIADLTDAETLLSTVFVDGSLVGTTTERTRPTKWAAEALLARVYLYTADYPDAEKAATDVINNSSLFELASLDSVFLKNSSEAIWQLQPVTTGITNTQDGEFFIMPATGPSSANFVYLTDSLLASFEDSDQRKTNWIDSITANNFTYYFPFKYKVNEVAADVSEYLMMIRLGEQYLIRAEARIQQGNIGGGLLDLNTIRVRAGLSDYAGATDQTSVLNALLHERRVELFTELGQRWLDLKRTSTVDVTMTGIAPEKGNSWESYQQLYPLLTTDIQKDPNLVQNSGYN